MAFSWLEPITLYNKLWIKFELLPLQICINMIKLSEEPRKYIRSPKLFLYENVHLRAHTVQVWLEPLIASGMAHVQHSFNFWLCVEHRHKIFLNFQRDLPQIKYLQISWGLAVDELQ